MIDKLKIFLSNRTNALLVGALFLILISSIFAATQILGRSKGQVPIEEVDLPFSVDGPYAILSPRRDGHAINLEITRVNEYDSFSYQLTYTDESGIDRGAGSPDTWINLKDSKGDYKQEILFGTCSKGNTSDPLHCVFDKGVENGTLLLKIRKGNKAYRVNIGWHLQQPDVALGKISSPDSHLLYTTEASREELANVGWSIVNDLSGAPKLPEGKTILGKVYAFNVPTAKVFPKGGVTFELAENPSSGAKIYRFVDSKNSWEMLETKIEGDKLSSQSEGNGIFAVLIDSKK